MPKLSEYVEMAATEYLQETGQDELSNFGVRSCKVIVKGPALVDEARILFVVTCAGLHFLLCGFVATQGK